MTLNKILFKLYKKKNKQKQCKTNLKGVITLMHKLKINKTIIIIIYCRKKLMSK